MAKSQLEQLKDLGTVVVADTGLTEEINKFKPQDTTTNPSLVKKALGALSEKDKTEFFNDAISKAIEFASIDNLNSLNDIDYLGSLACDFCSCKRGKEIIDLFEKWGYYNEDNKKLQIGNISTELDARLSYDIKKSIARALRILEIYKFLGVKDVKNKVLIKVASTWEGVKITQALNQQGIRCNMTLLFSKWQAAAASQVANAFLISPFVGRIRDWYLKDGSYDSKPEESKESSDALSHSIKNDPGVLSVKEIYNYFKATGSNTIVMGASFRNKYEILALAGCDRLTIGPKFLDQLEKSKDKVELQLKNNGKNNDIKLINVTKETFLYGMCNDPMATEKLAQGIRSFAADQIKLETELKQLIPKLLSK